MATKNRLPTKLSELLELALEDLEETEKTPGFVVDMNRWVADIDGVCHVCLAGCVMTQRFCDAPSGDIIAPYMLYLTEKISHRDFVCLKALDAIRQGDLELAYIFINDDVPDNIQSFTVVDYSENPDKFKEQMWEIVRYLKNVELEMEKVK